MPGRDACCQCGAVQVAAPFTECFDWGVHHNHGEHIKRSRHRCPIGNTCDVESAAHVSTQNPVCGQRGEGADLLVGRSEATAINRLNRAITCSGSMVNSSSVSIRCTQRRRELPASYAR